MAMKKKVSNIYLGDRCADLLSDNRSWLRLDSETYHRGSMTLSESHIWQDVSARQFYQAEEGVQRSR